MWPEGIAVTLNGRGHRAPRYPVAAGICGQSDKAERLTAAHQDCLKLLLRPVVSYSLSWWLLNGTTWPAGPTRRRISQFPAIPFEPAHEIPRSSIPFSSEHGHFH